MRELLVVGVGPGNSDQLTSAARDALSGADCVVAADRHLPLTEGHPHVLPLKDFARSFTLMDAERGSVAVLVSGDPGLYSLLPLLKERFPNVPTRVFPGISSLQSLCAAANETWQDAVTLSGHGRPLSEAKFLNTVERNRLTVLFCGGLCTPRWACESLNEAGLGERVEAVIGERLSYPDERITRDLPKNVVDQNFNSLSLMLIKNPNPWAPSGLRPRDCDFERHPKVPMTREEVRSVLLDRLKLTRNSVLWDIGAGTGSVSVAAALECPEGEVHAIECRPDALALLEQNRRKFHLHNMFLHAGLALGLLESLPKPTHAFIGGSGGELREILRRLEGFSARVVVSAVTLDTLSDAAARLKHWKDFEAVQISISASRLLSEKTLLMEGRNPVTLLCAEPREGEALE